MRMRGLRECEWETTRRDETEIEWHKWWRERQDIHGGGVFIWCVWVLILWPNMGCVEIDVETDTVEYHADIDCCAVEWRTHHCVNSFSKCMFCVLSSCFHSDRQLWECWYWDNDSKWWVVWMMNEDEWGWCDEVICVVIIRLIKNDWNGWIDELCEMALSNILTKWFETTLSCHLKNKILCFCV